MGLTVSGDSVLLGVCGRLGKATGLASKIWRVIFVVAALCFGAGVGLYLLLWIIFLILK